MTTRALIISRSLERFMRYGTRSVTMDDIAREVGVSKKTLYEHFENKNALLETCMSFDCSSRNEQEDIVAKAAKNALEEMYLRTQFILDAIAKVSPAAIYDLHKYHKALWDQHQATELDWFLTNMKRNIAWGQSEGLYYPDIDVEVVLLGTYFLMRAIFDPDLFDLNKYSKERVFETTTHQFIRGLCTQKGYAIWLELNN